MNKNIYITNEVSREELIKTFEILYDKQLINYSELQRATMLTNERYKPISQLNTN